MLSKLETPIANGCHYLKTAEMPLICYLSTVLAIAIFKNFKNLLVKKTCLKIASFLA